jgi:hypothetical protein
MSSRLEVETVKGRFQIKSERRFFSGLSSSIEPAAFLLGEMADPETPRSASVYFTHLASFLS